MAVHINCTLRCILIINLLTLVVFWKKTNRRGLFIDKVTTITLNSLGLFESSNQNSIRDFLIWLYLTGKCELSGLPVDNTMIYLLDKDFRPVKAGEVGELFVAGMNLAAGYVNGKQIPETY